MEPTAAGRALLHHARTVTHQMEAMRGELGQYAKGLKGHVRLMCNTAALSEYLPEALGAFLARHPHVDVDIRERPSRDVVLAVAEGLTDLGIAADSVDTGGLEMLPFRLDRLVLVAARDHPLATRRELAFADTLDQPYIGLDEGSALQDFLAGHAALAGRRLSYRVRVRGFDAVCRMVERNVGVAVVPDVAARRCQRAMALRRVTLRDPWATRRLNLCLRSLSALPAHARQLVDALTPGDTA
ncbi:MAG: LysR substrate-binding domain-containing protein [Magnetospirillum sp.]|nr:LysR substrate-binding domain-containing protein [Magnetospirillum sp.]